MGKQYISFEAVTQEYLPDEALKPKCLWCINTTPRVNTVLVRATHTIIIKSKSTVLIRDAAQALPF
jgi:hypothetical protein